MADNSMIFDDYCRFLGSFTISPAFMNKRHGRRAARHADEYYAKGFSPEDARFAISEDALSRYSERL